MGKKLVLGAVLVVSLMWVASCGSTTGAGGATGTGTDVPTITSIEQLPTATGPMASASADVSKMGVFKAATTGMNLLSFAQTELQQTDSMAACQTFNVVKDAIVSAAQADTILCYVQQMNDLFTGMTDGSGNAIDVYDGNWHIFNLNIVGAGNGSPDRVKMKIDKDAAGNITSFAMFMCVDNNGTSVQSEYTSQTISGTTFAMTALGNYSSPEWQGSHGVDVTGTLNASGAFTQKTIAMKNKGQGVQYGFSNWQEATLIQTPGAFVGNGYQKGAFTGSGTYQEAAYAVGEMLGDTSREIDHLAMGDGAVKVDAAYYNAQWGPFDPAAEVFAWLGDTAEAVDPATGSSFYADANAGTVPTPAASAADVAIAFSAAQTWDCSDDVAVSVDLPQINETEMNAACEQYGAMQHGWINCYEVIGQYEQQ